MANPSYSTLERNLNYTFKKISLLDEALTHPSYTQSTNSLHYQRLEFLGDSVLQLIIAETLFDKYNEAKEGQLSKMRATLVSGVALASYAKELSLGKYIKLSPALEKEGAGNKDRLLEDCFEAVIGAIYLDGGYSAAQSCILSLCSKILIDAKENIGQDNPKGILQEILQNFDGVAPQYQLVEETGPDHNKQYKSIAVWKELVLGEGSGSSKQTAEIAAAANALELKKYQNN